MLCHKSTSGYRNSFHRLLLRSTFSRNLSTRFDFLPLFSFPLSFSRNHRANFVPDISPSPLLIFHSIEFERSGIETLAKYKRIVREMLEQLLHRTKRTISSDQRIADPRNVATQHNVAVLCVETKAGRRPVGEKEKAEKKKESCKIRSKTLRSPVAFRLVRSKSYWKNSMHPDLSISLFFIPPEKYGEKSSNSNPAEGGKLRNENSIL